MGRVPLIIGENLKNNPEFEYIYPILSVAFFEVSENIQKLSRKIKIHSLLACPSFERINSF